MIKKRNTILMIAVVVLCTIITAACSDKRGVEISTFGTTRIIHTQRKVNDTQITSSPDIDPLTSDINYKAYNYSCYISQTDSRNKHKQ